MQDLRKFAGRNWQRASARFFRLSKKIYQYYKIRNFSQQKTILFIFGCQRSGTTLLTEIFERDFTTWVYGEFSKLSSLDTIHKIRLNPLPIVKTEIEKNRAPYIILKPLVESQNILKLLNYFAGSKALWVYRSYKDVALSNLVHWGLRNGINDLRYIIKNVPSNWRSEGVSEHTRKIINHYFSEDMNPYDAAALFWFARNRLFFEMDLLNHKNVMMCKYEDLVRSPREMIKNIYVFSGFDCPSDKSFSNIYTSSSGKGINLRLSPEIALLCKNFLDQLNDAYESKFTILN